MPSDPRPGTIPYYWSMEIALRQRLNERCQETGRTIKEELTEALLHWLDLPVSLSTRARATQSKRVRKKSV